MWAVFYGVLTSFFWWAFPRALVALGVYAVSDSVSSTIFTFLKSQVNSQVSSIPGQFVNAIHISGFLQGVTIILSAVVFAAGIKATKAAASSFSNGTGGAGGQGGGTP